jgi:aminopeptidase
MNGKSVEVDNTDAEGRLVLAGMIPLSCNEKSLIFLSFFPDAIYYTTTEYKPHTLIDVATLTG